MPEQVEARNAQPAPLQTNILGLSKQIPQTFYLPVILPTSDLTKHGVVESRFGHHWAVCDFTDGGAGGAGGGVIQLQVPEAEVKRAYRINRLQAFCYDLAAAPTDFYPDGVLTVDEIAAWYGVVAPLHLGDLAETAAAFGVAPPTPGTPEQLAAPAAAPLMYDKIATGTTRATYEPANGLVIGRGAGELVAFDSNYAVNVGFHMTFAAAQAVRLCVAVGYSVAPLGAWPER